MFKKIILTLALLFCIIVTSSSSSNKEANEPDYVGVETPIHNISETYTYYTPEWPEINEDNEDDWQILFEVLVDSVDYISIPPEVENNQLIDSLVYTYNLITLCNALDADVRTYSRELAEPSHIKPEELDWIREDELRNLFAKLDKAVYNFNNSDSAEEYNQSIYNVAEHITENYIKVLTAKVDTAELDRALTPSSYVKDIDSLHNMILNNPQEAFNTLKDRVLNEKYFIPQSYLTEEYALSCYANRNLEDFNTDQDVGLFEQIMNADIYSPNLTTIWRMWRAKNQMHQSPSNDGLIYNHYYNTYRNRIAKTHLMHYVRTGDVVALYNFIELATIPNIFRQGTYFGNSALIENMTLFWNPTRTDNQD